MSTWKNLTHRMAGFLTTILSAVLFISANSGSCILIHQPEAPKGLEKYSRVKGRLEIDGAVLLQMIR